MFYIISCCQSYSDWFSLVFSAFDLFRNSILVLIEFQFWNVRFFLSVFDFYYVVWTVFFEVFIRKSFSLSLWPFWKVYRDTSTRNWMYFNYFYFSEFLLFIEKFPENLERNFFMGHGTLLIAFVCFMGYARFALFG